MIKFKEIANAKEHFAYKNDTDIFSHTVDEKDAQQRVEAYSILLNKLFKFKLNKKNKCIDLGCGAGYIAKAFNQKDFNMEVLEYSNDAIEIIKKYNSDLNIIQGDMSKFKENEKYDFIFSREVYLITRINSFTEQYSIISNIIDSLKPGGIFMLIGSDISYPHCMDYDLIIKTSRKDNRLEFVSDKYYEIIFQKLSKYIMNKISYKVLNTIISPLIWYKKKYKNWASQYIIVFKKKK